MQQIVDEVRNFIIETMLFGSDDEVLRPNVSLLEQRIIDSTGVLELVDFLESTYGFIIEDHELVPANLDSLERIAAFVTHKQAIHSPPG